MNLVTHHLATSKAPSPLPILRGRSRPTPRGGGGGAGGGPGGTTPPPFFCRTKCLSSTVSAIHIILHAAWRGTSSSACILPNITAA